MARSFTSGMPEGVEPVFAMRGEAAVRPSSGEIWPRGIIAGIRVVFPFRGSCAGQAVDSHHAGLAIRRRRGSTRTLSAIQDGASTIARGLRRKSLGRPSAESRCCRRKTRPGMTPVLSKTGWSVIAAGISASLRSPVIKRAIGPGQFRILCPLQSCLSAGL